MYFFHIRRDGVLYLDKHGVDLPDEAAARAHAEVEARTVFRVQRGETNTDRRIEVETVAGPAFIVPPPANRK